MEGNYQPYYGERNKTRPAIYGGLLMAALSILPYLNLINCFCCAGIMLGGFLTVYLYIKDRSMDEPPLESKHGIILGAYAGIFGGLFETLASVLLIKLFSSGILEDVISEMQSGIAEMESKGEEVPEIAILIQEKLIDMMQEIRDKGFSLILTTFTLIFNTLKDVIFGLIGGLIGVAILQKRKVKSPPQNFDSRNYDSGNMG